MSRRRFIAAVVAISGMGLVAAMDGTIAVFALPKIQNELGLSDASRAWVITAYVLTFGGLMLLGGRLGDAFGRKRIFTIAAALFTVASAICSVAWDAPSLLFGRLLQGVAAGILAPTCLALVATTFPKGPGRNAATAIFGAMNGISGVLALTVGGALTDVSWRIIFMVNVPMGLAVIWLARIALQETRTERMKLDATGALLTTLICVTAVFGLSVGPQEGWLSVITVGSGALALGAIAAFVVVERRAENPIVPFDLFFDRNRVATFATIFLAGGVLFSLTVLVALYVQQVLKYSTLHAGLGFIPFVIAVGSGMGVSSRLVMRFPPRVVVIAGVLLVLSAVVASSMTLHMGVPYFPTLVVPLVVGAFGIGLANLPLMLSAIASVGDDRIGPTSAIALMLSTLGGPVVLAVIQAVITSRNLSLGGIDGPAEFMNAAQLHALDQSITFGLLWLAGLCVIVGGIALCIGYTARQVAHAQEVKKAIDAGDV
ncbi:integral membrane efflux protein EFPA [Mycolicibacterium flavescens]|uniref:MFS transporter n=1 Tax=Mycobacterium neumannii TaxID=2048551 RepID=UPI000B93DAA6|nr:MFS transporter [Mycobacterium neumannii]VEG38845.1 integral membrane efflux protein EFPA [Mycolicibacterium flavescens]